MFAFVGALVQNVLLLCIDGKVSLLILFSLSLCTQD